MMVVFGLVGEGSNYVKATTSDHIGARTDQGADAANFE
jgi:hypothetical protein